MAKFSSIQNTFGNGELSDKLVGRTDINEYKNGCKQLENFVPMVSGGIYKLPGSKYIASKFPNGSAETLNERALVPFVDVDRTPYIVTLYRIDTVNAGTGANGNRMEIAVKNTDGQGVATGSILGFFHTFPDGIGNGWNWVQLGTTLAICHASGNIPPIFVVKIGDTFLIRSLVNSYTWGNFTGVPGVPNGYMRVPYGPESFDADRVFKASTLSLGAATAEMIDSGGDPVKFFRAFIDESGLFRILNNYFVRVNIAANSGVFYGGPVSHIDIQASDVDAGNDQIGITGHNFMTGDEVSFIADTGAIPAPFAALTTYYIIKVDADTIELAATEADAGTGTAIDITSTGSNGFGIYGTFTSKSVGTNLLALPTGTTTGLTSWQLGQWSMDQGFPSVVTSYDERLIFMSSNADPDTVWNSRKGNLYHFMQSKFAQDTGSTDASGNNYTGALEATDAFSYIPASAEVGKISWASSQRSLFVGTDYTEFSISRVDGIYGPPNQYSINPQTYHGAAQIKAVRQGVTTLFISRDGKKVRDFRYSDNNGSNVSRNLSILADQLYAHGFVSGDYNGLNFTQSAWQEVASTMWLVNTLGNLISLTLDESGGAAGWARHNLGGEVKSIISLPTENSDWDNVWFIIKRGTNYYLEYIGEPFEHPLLVNPSTTPSDTPVYLHSAVVITNSPANVAVSGLSHLNGLEVYALADGIKRGPFTVTGGSITLPVAAEEIVVGISYVSKMVTMPIEAGAVIGSAQNLLKRVDQVVFKLYKSLGGKFGFGERLYDFEYKGVPANQTYTGLIDTDFHSTNAKDYRVTVEHSDPYPFNLLSAVMRGVTQE